MSVTPSLTGCAALLMLLSLVSARAAAEAVQAPRFLSQPLVTHQYTADPAVHVFDGKLYLYPSHDIETEITDRTNGNHYAMRDYHVFSMEAPGGAVRDHGVALDIKDIPWAKRQLWAPDAAYANGRYYLYFPVKDKTDVFRIGVATSESPAGPFKPEPAPMRGTFSIDPAVFGDEDGSFYLYLGGIAGGQLDQWPGNEYKPEAPAPTGDQSPTPPRVGKLRKDMLELAEELRPIVLLNPDGQPVSAGDHSRRFFEGAWVHKHGGLYYFSYSTGDTHLICYATGSSPYGPFTYRGVILNPVKGWTTHQSIVEYRGKWYLFYHDTQLSGKNNLRNVKMTELRHNPDGSIQTIDTWQP